MIDFLLQENVCETLVGFITQNSFGIQRPSPTDPSTDAMKLSYRAVNLLSPENISEPLNAFLTKKSFIIARKILDVVISL